MRSLELRQLRLGNQMVTVVENSFSSPRSGMVAYNSPWTMNGIIKHLAQEKKWNLTLAPACHILREAKSILPNCHRGLTLKSFEDISSQKLKCYSTKILRVAGIIKNM